MLFQHVTFLPSPASFSSTFLKIVVEVKASGSPHVLIMWFGVSKGMLPVKHFASINPLLASFELHGDNKTVTKFR